MEVQVNMEETMKDFEKELEESYKEIDTEDKDSSPLNEEEEAEQDSWAYLKEIKASGGTVKMIVREAVDAGVIGRVEGIRAFIPISKISASHVENTDEWVGKSIEAEIITLDKATKKLVLSGRAVEDKKLAAEKSEKIKELHVGDIVNGTVDSIKNYGAFIRMENGIDGLLHVSQISQKRIRTPYEVLREGQSVKAKIIKIEEGKISLSMKVLEEAEEDEADDINLDVYHDDTSIGTSLGDLLKGIKLG
ncbi:MAG: S1 RNA-binding domain-containing protein [Lachnospiraceae bacterium]|nr:S1 RNA-binding domain-containing protein [Lachnospiraceae bacterium]